MFKGGVFLTLAAVLVMGVVVLLIGKLTGLCRL